MSFDLSWIIQSSLLSVVALYGIGMFLAPVLFRNARAQNLAAHGAAMAGSIAGIVLGVAGLFAPTAAIFSVPSNIPLLTYQVRVDPLSSFFVLVISLSGLAASQFAIGYVREFENRCSIRALGGLYNAFLLSMILVVLADDGFFFLIMWEIMSLVSYFLVVTEHEKAETRYAGFLYLIMTHVGTAFIIVA